MMERLPSFREFDAFRVSIALNSGEGESPTGRELILLPFFLSTILQTCFSVKYEEF